jgi:signal transduction histidine kinase
VGSGVVALLVTGALVVNATTDSDALATACYLGVLVGAGIGAWIGAERAPRGQRLVPRLIAAGVSLTALGDVLWEVLDRLGAGTDVSIADAPWFASYVFLCAALWAVLGRGSRLDVDFVVDAVSIVAVCVLVFWSTSVAPILTDDSLTPLVRAVTAAYPIADAVLLALVVRVLTSRRGRSVVDASFAVGVSLWLAADIAYLHAPADSAGLVLMDAAWMVAPVLIARAAWRVPDPDVADAPLPATAGWVAQLVIAVGPLLVPPLLEVVADLRGRPDHPLQLFVGMAVLVALAFVRTARLLRSEERAHRELEVARDAALQASRAKSMFLANMSHEIRTPLTTVLASAELLEDTPLDDLQGGLLARMRRAGEQLTSLVEGILDFSRVEAGELELRPVVFDLRAVVDDLAEAYAPRAHGAGLAFTSRVDPRLPDAVVGDRQRLVQVVTNLLDNALKFTHRGWVELDVRPGEGPAGEGWVDIAVRDTGIGIAERDRATVFESFRQVDGSATRQYGGSGLGLAICRELTELMGGSVEVGSELGSGSTFLVRLPLAAAELPEPSAVVSHVVPG